MYSEYDIQEFRNSAKKYELDAPMQFWLNPLDELVKICNGIGAESWSIEKRKALTTALIRYAVCAAIHDVDYEYKVVSKSEADKRFLDNMYKVWRADYGWKAYLTISGLLERRIIRTCYYAVVIGGSEAWENGGDKRDECNTN